VPVKAFMAAGYAASVVSSLYRHIQMNRQKSKVLIYSTSDRPKPIGLTNASNHKAKDINMALRRP